VDVAQGCLNFFIELHHLLRVRKIRGAIPLRA